MAEYKIEAKRIDGSIVQVPIGWIESWDEALEEAESVFEMMKRLDSTNEGASYIVIAY